MPDVICNLDVHNTSSCCTLNLSLRMANNTSIMYWIYTRRDLPWVQHSSECLKHGHGPRTITDFHSKQLIIGNASCDLHGVDLVILLIRLKCTIRIITREVKHCVVTNPFNSRLDVANGWVNFQNSKYQACMAWELYMCVHACTAPTFLSAHKHEKFCNIIIRTHCIPS